MKRLALLLTLLCLGPARADESADLDALCADLPPNIQIEEAKLNASCGSGR